MALAADVALVVVAGVVVLASAVAEDAAWVVVVGAVVLAFA